MATNQVKQLWTVIVTAFLALFTALGLVTTTAAAAVPQSDAARNSSSDDATTAPEAAAPPLSPWSWLHARSLPPTMKQRIRAEAHGKSPSCRHRPIDDEAAAEQSSCDSAAAPERAAIPAQQRPMIPLQR
ncbi:hypothetical protein C3489_03490 [Streptomyces sp. Ru71]|uniref:DUF6344 domain-containing protein n=1 Tax=Streptomyces sp. Ru71 TaxID=2080746 RepID=UPI000CDD8195|nr:DUF6344 domain-containing protein [Streptomyces sp. Ru71]POX56859.1 hypothetical protein C3489_03490 [Streptomyces sp. Ru71]